MAWRAIHLLTTCGSRGTIQSSGLSEPPIFFYYGTVSVLAVMYHTVRTEPDKNKHRDKMNITNLIIGVVLYSVLLAIILISELVEEGDLRIKSCYGRVDEGPKPWPVTRIITLVYL